MCKKLHLFLISFAGGLGSVRMAAVQSRRQKDHHFFYHLIQASRAPKNQTMQEGNSPHLEDFGNAASLLLSKKLLISSSAFEILSPLSGWIYSGVCLVKKQISFIFKVSYK